MSDELDTVLGAIAERFALEALAKPARDAVSELTDRAREESPRVDASPVHWAEQIATSLEGHDPTSWPAHLGQLRAGDLWLCAALRDGSRAATSEFFARHGSDIARVARRLAKGQEQFEELRQQISIRLLVADPPRQPQIAGYRGEGSLSAWVRTLAARTGLNAIRDQKRAFRADLVSLELAQSAGFTSLSDELRGRFVTILESALGRLDRHQRVLLRLRYRDGMSSVSLSRVYDVHESTMSRRLARARSDLVESFERIATESLDPSGVRDLLGVLEDGVDLSLTSLFAAAETQ